MSKRSLCFLKKMKQFEIVQDKSKRSKKNLRLFICELAILLKSIYKFPIMQNLHSCVQTLIFMCKLTILCANSRCRPHACSLSNIFYRFFCFAIDFIFKIWYNIINKVKRCDMCIMCHVCI